MTLLTAGAELGPGVLGVGRLVAEHEHRQRMLRRRHLAAALLPVGDERLLQPLQQRARPLGVGARRVVADDVVLRVMHLEPRRQLARASCSASCSASSITSGFESLRAVANRGRHEPVVGAVGRLQQQAVRGFDEHLARELLARAPSRTTR